MQRKAVMKHAKPETPLERADRMIAELQDDGISADNQIKDGIQTR